MSLKLPQSLRRVGLLDMSLVRLPATRQMPNGHSAVAEYLIIPGTGSWWWRQCPSW
jgi:hypothetical protein